jgi:predicted enzyme related to lactoylglutathione lyase
MPIKYAHTNIIAEDWRRLAKFYEDVFDCVFVPPQRDQSGQWLADGTGVDNAHLQGVHLLLPGYGEGGPTLEIYSYSSMREKPMPRANRKGLGHLAFGVDDVTEIVEKVVKKGGKALGKVVRREVNAGIITFAYVTDPEGNIIEVQKWD